MFLFISGSFGMDHIHAHTHTYIKHNYTVIRFRQFAPINKNPFVEFHKLVDLVVNDVSLVFISLHKSLERDMLIVSELVVKTFES